MSEQEHNKDTSIVPMATLPEDKEVAEKVYHTRFPGSNYIDAVGRVHNFNPAGNLSTKSFNLQQALNKVADKPGSPIYTTAEPMITPAEKQPVEDIKQRAAEVAEQLRKSAAVKTGG